MSGYDVLEQFKQDDSLKNIPVLAVTAFAMKDDRERIISSGFDDYMSKPISIVPFLNMVKVYSA
jgi:two-component system cell cycle response regulator DivK